jgi:phenylalanyl-tRNA synthetase beta chain
LVGYAKRAFCSGSGVLITPVIELSLERLRKYASNKVSENQILESLPYLGLDIEKAEGDLVSVEYNPNRPDFCSEPGIARALVGQLGIKVGLPKYDFPKTGPKVAIEGREVKGVRPFIFCLAAELHMDDDIIKQLIGAQEDLHNGLGRKRSTVAIGLHDLKTVRPPITYYATKDTDFSFTPLGSVRPMSIHEIIETTEQGKEYGEILRKGVFPLLVDSAGTVLSFPPVINGEVTRLEPGAASLFVDVTATDRKAGETVIAILAAMISDLGGRVNSVRIEDRVSKSRFWTPDMSSTSMGLDLALANRILGLKLKPLEAKRSLEKCRLGFGAKNTVWIPRYRSDVLHKIDLVEELELGYGVESLTPEKVSTSITGSTLSRTRKEERIVEVLVGLGLTEIVEFALRSSYSAQAFGSDVQTLKVENPKSASYEYLLDSVTPMLLSVLGKTKGEEYPQHLYEQGIVFKRSDKTETGIIEESHVAVLLAESKSNFTFASSVLNSFCRQSLGADIVGLTPAEKAPIWFAEGRTARIILTLPNFKGEIGLVGEIAPRTLNSLGLGVPVSGFELNLEPFLM